MKNNVIQQDGKYYKKCKVVMLPTREEPTKGQILLRHLWEGTKNECRSLWQYNETVNIGGIKQYTTLNGSFRDCVSSFEPQHLYIISDETIKEGDWCIVGYPNKSKSIVRAEIRKIGNNLTINRPCDNYKFHISFAKKIIATTNESLDWLDTSMKDESLARPNGLWKLLPRPSNEFLQKYVEMQGSIDEVLVELEYKDIAMWARNEDDTYDCIECGKEDFEQEEDCNCIFYHLKVAPDNTITIRPVEIIDYNLIKQLANEYARNTVNEFTTDVLANELIHASTRDFIAGYMEELKFKKTK